MALERFDRSIDRRVLVVVRRASASPFVGNLAPLLALYAIYTLLRWTVVGHATAAGHANADRVLGLERTLRIDWELWFQRQLAEHQAVTTFFNHYYVFAFFPVLFAAAFVTVVRNAEAFRFWRTVFAVSLGLALFGFALFPLAPPRLLNAAHGYVDTLMLYGPQYYGNEDGASLFNAYGSIPSLVNEYAAMPSMHVGWSAIAAIMVVRAFPGRRWIPVLAVSHVAIMQAAVVATGNHYVIDGAAGLLVVWLAYFVARWMRREVIPKRAAVSIRGFSTGN
jgi:hypothetical protein